MMLVQRPKFCKIFKGLAKALIILCICAGWSEVLLVANTLLEISCCDSNDTLHETGNLLYRRAVSTRQVPASLISIRAITVLLH